LGKLRDDLPEVRFGTASAYPRRRNVLLRNSSIAFSWSRPSTTSPIVSGLVSSRRGHCTGWRAKAALAHTFAPGNSGLSVVGSFYALRAT
jgi:hypothetical protein